MLSERVNRIITKFYIRTIECGFRSNCSQIRINVAHTHFVAWFSEALPRRPSPTNHRWCQRNMFIMRAHCPFILVRQYVIAFVAVPRIERRSPANSYLSGICSRLHAYRDIVATIFRLADRRNEIALSPGKRNFESKFSESIPLIARICRPSLRFKSQVIKNRILNWSLNPGDFHSQYLRLVWNEYLW